MLFLPAGRACMLVTSPLVGEVAARSAAGEGMAPKAPAPQALTLSPTPPPSRGRGLIACLQRYTRNATPANVRTAASSVVSARHE